MASLPLAEGSRVGSYEIAALLGAGGMGEVYRARDTRVDRTVAVKVLPADLFDDDERLTRFEREARALARLNHPGIAVLYSFEEIEGAPPFHIIVMELVEGETLRAALASARPSLKKALDWARQIALALAAAHDNGIVHRDLKPENVIVTRDGRVKILDFGLAKLAHAEERPGAGATDLTTLPDATRPGVVLGTLGYMSPEQLKGLPADARSDFFSFGAILHEMLSGKRTFLRPTSAETISAILKDDPPELSSVEPGLPAALERVVARCLEKDPERRFHSAHDLAFALESLASTPSSAAASAAATPAPSRAPARLRAGAALAVGALAVGAAAGFLASRLRAPAPLPSFQRLTFRNGAIWSARFTPDGQTVVYAGAWESNPLEVFLTRLESPESRPLGLLDASLLAVSPASELAAMLQARTTARGYERSGTLARVPLAGGSPRPVLDNVRYADFGPDGRELMVERVVDGKHRIEFPPGKVLYETTLRINSPRLSPKGDAVAFSEEEVRGSRTNLRVVDLAGHARTLTTASDWWNLAWSPDGREVIYAAPEPGVSHTVTSLQAVSLAGRNRLLLRFPGTLEMHDVARDGRLLLARLSFGARVLGAEAGAKTPRDLSWLDGPTLSDLSQDGASVLITETEEGGGPRHAIYLRKTDGSPATRIGEGDGLALSPDAKWVLAREVGAKGTLTLLPTGVGTPRTLSPEGLKHTLSGRFFPGGERLVVEETAPGAPPRTYLVAIDGAKPTPLAPSGFALPDFGNPVSPDGRLVALVDPEGRTHLFPAAGGAPSPLTGLEPGEFPIQWSPDGRAVYTHRGGGLPAKVFRLELATGRRELVREVAPADAAGVTSIETVLVTPDGRLTVYTYYSSLASLYVVSGLL